MSIQSVPVDQGVFTRSMLLKVGPKLDRETGNQHTNKDGTQRKWVAEVYVCMPSRFDASREDSGTLVVTVTSADDPAAHVAEGTSVWFADLAAGVMDPEFTDGKVRGGRLFWSATGIQSRKAKS